MRRRLLFLLFAVNAIVACMLLAWPRIAPTATKPTMPGPPPFTSLEVALETKLGWTLHIPPQHPGPYRLIPGGMMAGEPPTKTTSYVNGEDGEVLEEIRIDPNKELDQSIVWLETPTGRRTMAVLKRKRD